MRLNFRAGDFEIETYTEGYPNWMELTYRGSHEPKVMRFDHRELRDLMHVLDRMRANARGSMSERYKHEFD